MNNTERRRKLKQAYEVMSLGAEVVRQVAEDYAKYDGSNTVAQDELLSLADDFATMLADLSGYTLKDGPLSGT